MQKYEIMEVTGKVLVSIAVTLLFLTALHFRTEILVWIWGDALRAVMCDVMRSEYLIITCN